MRQYDIIDGYRLEVGPHWADYTPEQRAKICNGVGAADQPHVLATVLAALPFLTPASRPHDIDYLAGGGNRERLVADQRFRRNAYRLAKAHIGGFWSRLFRKPVRLYWAFATFEIECAYRTLRLFGSKAFKFTTATEGA